MSEKTCSSCKTSFTCDIENGKDSCWCFDLPNVIPLGNITINDSSDNDCLCPQCLQNMIENTP